MIVLIILLAGYSLAVSLVFLWVVIVSSQKIEEQERINAHIKLGEGQIRAEAELKNMEIRNLSEQCRKLADKNLDLSNQLYWLRHIMQAFGQREQANPPSAKLTPPLTGGRDKYYANPFRKGDKVKLRSDGEVGRINQIEHERFMGLEFTVIKIMGTQMSVIHEFDDGGYVMIMAIAHLLFEKVT